MLQNQRACQLVRSKTGCEPLALAVAAGRCAAGVLGAVKHQRFSDQQLETFAARAPGICPKPVCDAGEPCPLPPQDDAVDVSVIVPVHNGERFLRACLDSILHQNTTRRLQVLAVEDGSTDGSGAILAEYARQGGVTVLHPEQGGSAGAHRGGYRAGRLAVLRRSRHLRCGAAVRRSVLHRPPAAGCGGAARHSLGQAVPPDPV